MCKVSSAANYARRRRLPAQGKTPALFDCGKKSRAEGQNQHGQASPTDFAPNDRATPQAKTGKRGFFPERPVAVFCLLFPKRVGEGCRGRAAPASCAERPAQGTQQSVTARARAKGRNQA